MFKDFVKDFYSDSSPEVVGDVVVVVVVCWLLVVPATCDVGPLYVPPH